MNPVMVHKPFVKKVRPRAASQRTVRTVTFGHELKTALGICADINTPRSLAVWYLLCENSPESIAQLLSLPPVIRRNSGLRYPLPRAVRQDDARRVVQAIASVSTDMFADDYLVSEMMVKNPHLNSGIDLEAVALESFHESEAKNKLTNNRVLTWYGSDDPNLALVSKMRAIIARILGKLSHDKILFATRNFRFGPGATSAISGADVLLSKKYATVLHATPRLCPYVRTLIGAVWGSFPGTDLILTDESRTTTVPKNAKTNRLIGIEAHMNIFVQLGIGALLRRQLKRFGVDLDTQSWNQYLASVAGEWGLSTIDLRGASNSVCHRVVRLLLPWEWYEFLFLARTDFTSVGGERVALEMFSSMGNGYTFELESLIFYAAALACGSHKDLTAVFGDDIIVDRSVADKLVGLLEMIGFETNTKKTFLDGNFFESCGTDWFNGVNVRPFYLKGEYNDVTECNLYIPNSIRRYAHRRGNGHSCNVRFKKAWYSAYRRASPLEKRTAIPDGSGDDGFVKNFDEAAPSRVWCNHTHAWQGRVLPLRPVRSNNTDMNGAYIAALHRGASDSVKSVETIRGRNTRSDRLRSRPTFGWVDLGSWA